MKAKVQTKVSRTLNDFQRQLSESFYNKINLLEKIIGDKHFLTTGTFKEKILIDFLNNNLPQRLKAKSGFVIFPTEKEFKNKANSGYNHGNASSYVISKQIDIIIYDAIESCPVFEDESIVLLSPESVKNVIEVKGVFSISHFNMAIKQLNDFCDKWKDYKSFVANYPGRGNLKAPELIIFAWDTKKDKKGHEVIKEKYVREKLSKLLKQRTTYDDFEEFPFIERVLVYDTYEILLIDFDISTGYIKRSGKNNIFNHYCPIKKRNIN